MIHKSETTTSAQASTPLFDNTIRCLATGRVRLFFSISDLNPSCFFWRGHPRETDTTVSLKGLRLCFVLTSSLPEPDSPLRDSAHTGCGVWEVRPSPAAAPLGWRVPRRGPGARAWEMPLPSLAPPGEPSSAPSPFPFSSLSAADGQEAVILFPRPTSAPQRPALPAPGSRKLESYP